MRQFNILTVLTLLLQVIYASYIEVKKIQEAVLDGYDLVVRPADSNGSLNVFLQLKIQKLVKLDMKEQVLTIKSLVMLNWKDPQLTWNASQYNDTERIHLGSDQIWTPDIVLYNTAWEEREQYTDIYTSRALVMNNGEVIWNNAVTWRVSCGVDIMWFPVDRQVCTFSFGSWSYSVKDLSLKFFKEPSDASDLFADNLFIASGEWDPVSLETVEENIKFICCPEEFSSIKYTLTLDRLSEFFFLYIILPMIALSFLFLLVFFIPAQSGERMGFGVSILLSLTVYMLVVSEKVPENSNTRSMLGTLFCAIFYLLSAGLCFASITIICSFKTRKPHRFLMRLISKKTEANKPSKNMPDVFTIRSSIENFRTSSRINGIRMTPHIQHNRSNGSSRSTENLYQSKELDFNKEWQQISQYLDRRGFILFFACLILLPVLTTLAFPKDGLQG